MNSSTVYYPVSNPDYDYFMQFCQYFKVYFYILLTIVTILFLIILYLIFYVTPKEAVMLKWHLLNCSVNNYLLVLLFVLWQPITLTPYFGGFSQGVIKFLGKEGMMLCMNLFSVLMCATILSLLACQTNKVVIFQPPGYVSEFFMKPKNMIMTYVGLLLANAVILVGSQRLACKVYNDYVSMLDSKKESYSLLWELILKQKVRYSLFYAITLKSRDKMAQFPQLEARSWPAAAGWRQKFLRAKLILDYGRQPPLPSME